MEGRRNFLGKLLVPLCFGWNVAAQKYPESNPANQSAARQIYKAKQPVIPLEVIQEYSLEPLNGTGPWVEGEDGKFYSIDDALRVLFLIAKPHWQRQKK